MSWPIYRVDAIERNNDQANKEYGDPFGKATARTFLSFPLCMVKHFKVLRTLIERGYLLISCFELLTPHFYNIKIVKEPAELN